MSVYQVDLNYLCKPFQMEFQRLIWSCCFKWSSTSATRLGSTRVASFTDVSSIAIVHEKAIAIH